MLKRTKDGSVRLTVSPFIKVVLVVIAAALSIIALRGFLGPGPLYAQSGSGSMDVNLKSIGGSSISGSLPVEIKALPFTGIKISEFPYSGLKVKVSEN